MKRNKVYKALDSRLIEVTTMGELSLGRPKGGGGRLIGGLISHSFLHSYFGTLITGRLMEVQMY